MLIDELRAAPLMSGLTDEQLGELVRVGDEYAFSADQELFREGVRADHLWVLLEGSLELSRVSAGDRVVLAQMQQPGQWAGGFSAWTSDDAGAGYRATATALTDGRMFRIPSDELGRLVQEWFSFGKHLITGIYGTVRSIEATARQRESLVALGTMSAGLAHELNNPAAASLRAVDEMRVTCDAMLSSLAALASHRISAEQFVELDRLRRMLEDRPVASTSAVEMMDREDELGSWLEHHGVARAWELAPVFAASGADTGWFELLLEQVGPEPAGDALRWAATTLTARSLLNDLSDTTRRISNLVGAVKSYSQMDRAPLQRTDLREGLNSTLVMLSSKLGDVEVIRQFDDDVPEVEAYPAELNQVWTNLIDNAVDAMGGRGTIHIATCRNGSQVEVDITDDGPGMSDDVLQRAFEPFFTTKDVGKGTGLGLDISRRIIVERHHGEIGFESRPGRTTAHVRLPISR